jgi:hypothetical protein
MKKRKRVRFSWIRRAGGVSPLVLSLYQGAEAPARHFAVNPLQ